MCKSHTVEALNKLSLEVLNEITKSVKQQEITKTQPCIEIIFLWQKTLVEAGTKSLLSLITHDNSAPKLTFLISYICMKRGCQEKRIPISTKMIRKTSESSLINT